MAIKFIKSMVLSPDIYLYYDVAKTPDLMKNIMKLIEEYKAKNGRYNMIESAVFEFLNQYTSKMHDRQSKAEHFAFVKEY